MTYDPDHAMLLDCLPSNTVGIGGQPGGDERDVIWGSEVGNASAELGYSTGTIMGRATNTVPVPVNTVPVAVRVRYNRTYPRVVGSITSVVSVQELRPNLLSFHP